VFATELPSQLRSRGIDLDRISQIRARQDGKTLDKTSNTKYAAQPIAEHIQGWLPTRPTDSDSQHEITSLRNQIAELRQRLGDEPAEVSTPPRTGQQSPSSQSTSIQKISDEELSTFSTSHHSNHVEFLAYGEYALYWLG